MTDVLTPAGILVPLIEPGSPEWMQRMSASKIAAVMGLSPWESKFSLYHRMAGLVPNEPDDDVKRRGHYLEPAVAAWFADQHPDWLIEETGTFIHPERDWQAASPDRLVIHPDGHTELLEIKSSTEPETWGEPGTDEIPVYYRAQVLWQLDTLGLRTCHVAVILPFLEFQAYRIEYDAGEAAILQQQARQFLDDLRDGNRPAIDDSAATYQVVRELHPDIEPTSIELDDDLARAYLAALAAEKDATAEKRRTSALVVEAMGSAKDAYHQGRRIASRQCKTTDSTPYLCAAKGVADQFRSAA